jgi:hypothetical protein
VPKVIVSLSTSEGSTWRAWIMTSSIRLQKWRDAQTLCQLGFVSHSVDREINVAVASRQANLMGNVMIYTRYCPLAEWYRQLYVRLYSSKNDGSHEIHADWRSAIIRLAYGPDLSFFKIIIPDKCDVIFGILINRRIRVWLCVSVSRHDSNWTRNRWN